MKKAIRIVLKGIWGRIFYYGGVFHLYRIINNLILNRRLTILMYHRVGDDNYNNSRYSLPFLFVSKNIFECQIRFIKRWYKIIGFEELSQLLKGQRMPRNCLIITFDDGYGDNFTNAYEILKRYGVKATFFLTVNRIGENNNKLFWWDRVYYLINNYGFPLEKISNSPEHEEVLAILMKHRNNESKTFAGLNKIKSQKIESFLNIIQETYKIDENELKFHNSMLKWQEVFQMKKDMEIGSHTCNHDNLVELSKSQRYKEISESKKQLEVNLNKGIIAFSYPCGNSDRELEEIIKKEGYRFAVSASPGVNNLKNLYSLKRINVWEETSLSLSGHFSKGYFAYKISKI